MRLAILSVLIIRFLIMFHFNHKAQTGAHTRQPLVFHMEEYAQSLTTLDIYNVN